MRSALPFLAALYVGVHAGCSTDGSGAGADEALRAFALEEELRIDGYEHDLVPIDTAVRVAVARDGTIAIAQRQDNEIRFFSYCQG